MGAREHIWRRVVRRDRVTGRSPMPDPYERNDAQDRRHNGRSSCPHRGGSGVRTWTDRPPRSSCECRRDQAIAASEPEARPVPLPLRKEQDETMGLRCSQMADKGAARNGSTTAPKTDRRGRMVVYPSVRRSVDVKHGQRVLRRAPDGLVLHAPVRLAIRPTVGHSRQLAGVGAARRRSQGQGQRPGLRALAEHRPCMRASLEGATTWH